MTKTRSKPKKPNLPPFPKRGTRHLAARKEAAKYQKILGDSWLLDTFEEDGVITWSLTHDRFTIKPGGYGGVEIRHQHTARTYGADEKTVLAQLLECTSSLIGEFEGELREVLRSLRALQVFLGSISCRMEMARE